MTTMAVIPAVYVYGRVQGVTRRRLATLMTAVGLHYTARVVEADTIVMAYGTASKVGSDFTAVLPRASRPERTIRSEGWLKQRLGLSPPSHHEPRTLTLEDVARAAKLSTGMTAGLAAYDVIEPVNGLCSFGDLRAAQAFARLLGQGFEAAQIVQAALQLRQSGQRLSDTRLAVASNGSIVQEVKGVLADLVGQMALPFRESAPTVDEIFERAESAEGAGDHFQAERWYRLAAKLDRKDPVIPFNLGNVLDEQGRPEEAILAYRQALDRDPAFPEAWFNLALIAQRRYETDRARSYLMEAVAADPAYQDAAYALARLLTETEQFAEAIAEWTRYIGLRPTSQELAQATRYLKLCRLSVVAGTGGA